MTIMAALVPHYIIGIALGAGVYGMFMLSEGFFILRDDIPKYWIWSYYIAFHTYSFRSVQFHRCDDACIHDSLTGRCHEVSWMMFAVTETGWARAFLKNEFDGIDFQPPQSIPGLAPGTALFDAAGSPIALGRVKVCPYIAMGAGVGLAWSPANSPCVVLTNRCGCRARIFWSRWTWGIANLDWSWVCSSSSWSATNCSCTLSSGLSTLLAKSRPSSVVVVLSMQGTEPPEHGCAA